MPRKHSPAICQCCGLQKDWADFHAGAPICSLCDTLTVREAVAKTRAHMLTAHVIAATITTERKLARQTARQQRYETDGKRCTSCHAYRPPSAYNRCAPMADGLQPACRACNVIRLASIKSGGLRQWHAIRAALRAKNGG